MCVCANLYAVCVCGSSAIFSEMLLSAPLPSHHLLENPGRHLMAAVEDDMELLSPLHLLQQRFGVLGLRWQLPDF